MQVLRLIVEIPNIKDKDALEVKAKVEKLVKDYEGATVTLQLLPGPPPMPVPPPTSAS